MNPWMLFAHQHPAFCAVVCFVPLATAWFCATFYILCGAVFGVNPFERTK